MSRTFRLLQTGDVETLQVLLESVPQYAEQVTGYPPGPSDAALASAVSFILNSCARVPR